MTRTCGACGRDISHKRPQAKWCDAACANKGWHLKRRRKAQDLRPRCLIGMAPIRYGRNGTRLDARTCGKRECAWRAYNWFRRGSAAA